MYLPIPELQTYENAVGPLGTLACQWFQSMRGCLKGFYGSRRWKAPTKPVKRMFWSLQAGAPTLQRNPFCKMAHTRKPVHQKTSLQKKHCKKPSSSRVWSSASSLPFLEGFKGFGGSHLAGKLKLRAYLRVLDIKCRVQLEATGFFASHHLRRFLE